MKRRIYLDYNATAPVLTEVYPVIEQALRQVGNPSSIHAEGREVQAHIRRARQSVADLVGANSDQVIFTSGGTEANNLVLSPLMMQTKNVFLGAPLLFVGASEHPSVLAGGRFLPDQVKSIDVDNNGLIGVDKLKAALKKHGLSDVSADATLTDEGSDNEIPFMVSIMYANNETGIIQDIEALGAIVQKMGGVFHVDGVQAAGKIEIDFKTLPVDFLSVSGHKLGAMQGVGALIARQADKVLADVLLRGGGQEKNRRGGTENVPAIASFGQAVTICQKRLGTEATRLQQLQAQLEDGLKRINKEVEIIGQDVKRLPNTTCFVSPDMRAETLLMGFDLAGIAVSSGSACSSGKVAMSHVLKAMGYRDMLCQSALRVSYGWQSTKEDIEAFLSVYSALYERHKNVGASV